MSNSGPTPNFGVIVLFGPNREEDEDEQLIRLRRLVVEGAWGVLLFSSVVDFGMDRDRSILVVCDNNFFVKHR